LVSLRAKKLKIRPLFPGGSDQGQIDFRNQNLLCIIGFCNNVTVRVDDDRLALKFHRTFHADAVTAGNIDAILHRRYTQLPFI